MVSTTSQINKFIEFIAVLGDVIFPKVAREENRIVTELCDENGKPYAVIEIK